MVDGEKRKRRNGERGQARQKWYGWYRNRRFAQLGGDKHPVDCKAYRKVA